MYLFNILESLSNFKMLMYYHLDGSYKLRLHLLKLCQFPLFSEKLEQLLSVWVFILKKARTVWCNFVHKIDSNMRISYTVIHHILHYVRGAKDNTLLTRGFQYSLPFYSLSGLNFSPAIYFTCIVFFFFDIVKR